MEKHPLHIKNPDLQTSREVQKAVVNQEKKTGEKVPNDPSERIDAYLKRLEKLILDPKNEQKKKNLGDIEHTDRPRALSLLRKMILDEYVRPNKEQMAQGASRVEERAARQMGIQAEYNDEALEQRGEIAVGDLESSLDQWITYLSDPNEPYPTWFRYYAFRNILNLGEYDKDKQEFPKRSKGTFKLFPDVDRGALAYVEEIMTAAQDPAILNRIRESQKEFDTPEADIWTTQKAQAFVKMSFAKQYAEGIKSQGEITPELRAETRGQWVHYHQNEDPKQLWKSLQNKGTAWCTRGYPTAKTQLEGGDFHVYYTLDATGEPTIPRIAIRMEDQNKIAEDPRGVFDSQQNLEPNMVDILDTKLKEFGSEADTYRKKSWDMKKLTEIETKTNKGESLTKAELEFLYEINSKIEGFGYGKDPRIAELRQDRNTEADMLTIFECTRDQIAHVPSEITENTRAYVGQLESGIFQKLPETLEHVYTSFPEEKIYREHVEIGGESKKELLLEIEALGIHISDSLLWMMEDLDFTVEVNREEVKLIRLSGASLGFKTLTTTRYPTTNYLLERVKVLGLELCPFDATLKYRLKYKDQPLEKLVYMGTKKIGHGDDPIVLFLSSGEGNLLLCPGRGDPYYSWNLDDEFVFRLP